jgi:hypothetical protein
MKCCLFGMQVYVSICLINIVDDCDKDENIGIAEKMICNIAMERHDLKHENN